jgi:hypothetical protein
MKEIKDYDKYWNDEGNSGGALFTSDEKQSCLPVMR